MTSPQIAQQVAYNGLSQVAHAIRRSTALWASVMTSPEGTSKEQITANAEYFAKWVRGTAPGPDNDQAPLGRDIFNGG